MKNETADQLVSQLWQHIKNQEWNEVKKLLSEDFECSWPQSKEKFNRDNFIEVNRVYPGTHEIQIMNVWSENDQWDRIDTVISEVYIKSKTPEGKDVELFALSIFELEDDGEYLIRSVREYWADTYLAPAWRKHLSTPYEAKKIKVAVDVLEIADSMEDQSNEIESQSYLDIETGEVKFVSHEVSNLIESGSNDFSDLPEWQMDEVEIGKKVLTDKSRFIPIPRLESHESFKFMEDFVDEVKDSKFRENLIDSLRGSRPFRRFKDCLSQDSDLEKQWYSFKNKKLQEVVKDFISSIDHARIELIFPKNL